MFCMGSEFCCLEISCTPLVFQGTNSMGIKSFQTKGRREWSCIWKKDNKAHVPNMMSKNKQLHTAQTSRHLSASIFLSLGAFRALYAKRSRLWSCKYLPGFSSKYPNTQTNHYSLNPVAQCAKWLQAQVATEKAIPEFLVSRLKWVFSINFRRNYTYAWEIRTQSLWSMQTCLFNLGLTHTVNPSPNPICIPSKGKEEQASPVTGGFLPTWLSLQRWQLSHL